MTRLLLIGVLIVIGLWGGLSSVQALRHVQAGRQLRLAARPFERSVPGAQTSLLLAGDSVVFGVGASDPAHSIAGLFGRDFPSANIRNVGVSGAETDGLVQQLQTVQGQHFSFVVIVIGANDVVHFANLAKSASQLDSALALAKNVSDEVVLMPEGNISNAPIFPWLASLVLTPRSRQFRMAALVAAQRHGVTYVDVFHERSTDPWRKRPTYFYAADYFHPADPGYADWYQALRQAIRLPV